MSYQGNAATLVEISDGYEPNTGRFVQYRYRGTKDGIDALIGGLGVTNGFERRHNGPVWELIVRYSNGAIFGETETPSKEERLRFNRVTKPLFEHPAYRTLTKAEKTTVRETWEQRVKTPTFTGANSALMDELYGFLADGVDSYPIDQAVVTVTYTASISYVWATDFTNAEKIFTTAGMISDAGLTASWASGLPASGQDQGSTKYYGWRKSPPEILTTGSNRTQLVLEYDFGVWDSALWTIL